MTTILIIEDNDMNRDMLQRRLVRQGYQVVAAPDGVSGLAAAEMESPDLILLDIRLPGIDGLQVLSRLRSQTSTESIPVVALTAHALAGDRERYLQAGCDAYETKPVNFGRLVDTIEQLVPRAA